MLELLSSLHYFCGLSVSQEYARQVPTAEAAAYAARMGCLFVETSAKTAIGVCAAFRDVVERIVETPELWAGPESHNVTPPKVMGSEIEPQEEENQSEEKPEWVQTIASISFGRNLTIRFGGTSLTPV